MDYFRYYHGTINDPRWRLISKQTGVLQGVVSHIYTALMEHASRAIPFGSVQSFNCDAFAADSEFDDDHGFAVTTVTLVVTAFYNMGIIDTETHHLVEFMQRNPISHAMTSAERSRLYRQRHEISHSGVSRHVASRDVRDFRDGVSEKKKVTKKENNTPKKSPPMGGQKKGSWKLCPEDWGGPTAAHRRLARELGVDVDAEAAKFRDHEFPRAKSDPDRTFNNWLRNAVSFNNANGTRLTGTLAKQSYGEGSKPDEDVDFDR